MGRSSCGVGHARTLPTRVALACSLLASLLAQAEKPVDPLAEARKRFLAGSYEEALEAYTTIGKANPALAGRVAFGLADTYWQKGDSTEALAVLDRAISAWPKDANLLAKRAELYMAVGEWAKAEADVATALKLNDKQLLARTVKARLLNGQGKLDEAKEALRWMVRYYNQADITSSEDMVSIAECAAEFARWTNNSAQIRFILNEVIKDALKLEPGYWPAELFAGQLLLEKYNRPDALESFDAVLKLNPKVPDAMVGKAQSALSRFELKDADAFAEQALKINPRHPAALRIKADIFFAAGDDPAAEKVLKQALQTNPRDVISLGKLAAAYVMSGQQSEFDKLTAEVQGFDAKPGVYYQELASVLEDRKRYALAEQYYKQAAELRPMLSAPRTGLGMLYLRLGKEQEGRELLDAAFKLDPFHVRVANMRRVQDHLKAYSTIETEHYLIRFDPKTDAVLAAWLEHDLETMHAELKRQFQFEPEGKILIEVFNSHEMFSGRTVGLPDLHTIGACTGRVVAMASPTAKGLGKPFNWGRVMRHELTHIFNLAQTEYQCPHWITEGLAVENELMARPPLWSQVLRDRFLADDLLNLDTILLGFVRPRSRDEWTLAYCQSQLYVQYLVKTHGQEAVGKLLNAFREGKDTTAALQAACAVRVEDFEAGYKKMVAEVVHSMGTPTATAEAEMPMTFAELEKAAVAEPDNNDLQARLADALFKRGKVAEAKKIAETVLGRDANNATAATVQARILIRGGEVEEATKLLETALKAKPDDYRLLQLVGRLYIEQMQFKEAAVLFEQGQKLHPLQGDWLEQLARIYAETKEVEKLIPTLATIVSQDPDDLPSRLKLAKLYFDAKNYAEASKIAEDALRIDVNQAEALEMYIDCLKNLEQDDLATKVLSRYKPKD